MRAAGRRFDYWKVKRPTTRTQTSSSLCYTLRVCIHLLSTHFPALLSFIFTTHCCDDETAVGYLDVRDREGRIGGYWPKYFDCCCHGLFFSFRRFLFTDRFWSLCLTKGQRWIDTNRVSFSTMSPYRSTHFTRMNGVAVERSKMSVMSERYRNNWIYKLASKPDNTEHPLTPLYIRG